MRVIILIALLFTMFPSFVSPAHAQFGGGGNVLVQQAEQAIIDQLTKQAGEALGQGSPLLLDQHTALEAAPDITDFHPQFLQPTAQDLERRLPPGDYAVPVMGFCTQYSIHAPGRGLGYKLARVQGKQAGAISALLVQGSLHGVSPYTLNADAWRIQAGVPLSQWSPDDQTMIHSLIPTHEKDLQGDFLQQLQATYDSKSTFKFMGMKKRIPGLPSFEALIGMMGEVGKTITRLEASRQILTNKTISAERLPDALFVPQGDGLPRVLPPSSDPSPSPWAEVQPGVFARYTIIDGNMGRNLYEFRVTPAAASQSGVAANPAHPLRLAGFTPNATGPTLGAITGMGDPSGNGAALKIGYPIGQGAQALIAVPILAPTNEPGKDKDAAVITSFTLTPSQVDVAGPTVTATVQVTGQFGSMDVSWTSDSVDKMTSHLTRNGAVWTGAISTSFLNNTQANPVILVATGTRLDGSTASASTALRVGERVSPLLLTLVSDQPAGLNQNIITIHGSVTNPSIKSEPDARLEVSLPPNVVYSSGSAKGLSYDEESKTLTWAGSLPVSPQIIHEFSFTVFATSEVSNGSQLIFTATAYRMGFENATLSRTVLVGNGAVPDTIDVHEDASGLLDGKVDVHPELGTPPLSATVEPDPEVYNFIRGGRRPSFWLGVTKIERSGGATWTAGSGGTVEQRLAATGSGLISPDVSPTYNAKFPIVGSALTFHVGFTAYSFVCTISDDILSFCDCPVNFSDVVSFASGLSQISGVSKAYKDLTDPHKAKDTGIADAQRDLTTGLTKADFIILKRIFKTKLGKSFTSEKLLGELEAVLSQAKLVAQFSDLIDFLRKVPTFPGDLKVVFYANQSQRQ